MLELKASKWKAALGVVGCLIFIAGGVLMIRDGAHLLGWACVLCFGLVLPLSSRALLSSAPQLIISEEGIKDAKNGLGLIPWSEITQAELRKVQGSSLLTLTLRDPKAWAFKRSALSRWLAPVNRTLGYSDVTIALTGLSKKPSEVFAEVKRHVSG